MLIVRRSTFDHIENMLRLERQSTSSMQRSLAEYSRDLAAVRLELENVKAAHAASLEAQAAIRTQRDQALEREREASSRASCAASKCIELGKKLAETDRSLDLSRTRREKIGSDLDALRSETMDLVEEASTAIRWLLAHSSGGSEADARATLLRKACEPVENLLNT